MVKNNRSAFLLTISTNRGDNEIDRELFKEVYDSFFAQIYDFIKFLPHSPGETREEKLTFIEKLGKDRHSISLGPIQKRVHIHSLIQITHHTRIHLNKEKILKYFEEEMNMKGFHIDIQGTSDSIYKLKRYLKHQD